MMRVRSASAPAPGRLENEDHVFQYGELVGVLDGATVPDGFDTGCVHGPAWYVRRLAARLGLAAADRPAAALTGNLAAAILAVRADHGGTCDLDHPGTPSATVCLLRHGGDHVDYLVLCDSPLVLDLGERVQVISDERLRTAMADLRQKATTAARVGGEADPATRFRRAVALQREQMNQTHGYWVAAANPDAAYHAVAGSLPLHGPERVRRAALLTDGASVAVEQFGLFDWRGLLDLLSEAGPGELIRRVRLVEAGDGQRRSGFKRHDDATAALCEFCD
ncbi:protein phosphatase 2C domain-containing protein [Plantactinospora mayteni]|uniref:Uncharacterized protein n=1 Tax=Plantactinospora mayteni TaxID=566021 RepID=A0ABQ4ENM9_9ACTN|nr:hypothetical protein [Plantactinospora mayteni]GIG96268.1 hypothetical protein Pma05_28410 [Plantactinospora mayteni]